MKVPARSQRIGQSELSSGRDAIASRATTGVSSLIGTRRLTLLQVL